jgi:hypothetical protein
MNHSVRNRFILDAHYRYRTFTSAWIFLFPRLPFSDTDSPALTRPSAIKNIAPSLTTTLLCSSRSLPLGHATPHDLVTGQAIASSDGRFHVQWFEAHR